MAPKKEIISNSLSLFDDDAPVKVKETKTVKSSSKKDPKKQASHKKEAEPKASTKKTIKTTSKNKNSSNDNSRTNTTSNRTNRSSKSDNKSPIVKKEDNKTDGGKHKRSSDTSKESNKTVKTTRKTTVKSDKTDDGTSKSRSKSKRNTDKSEAAVKSEHRKSPRGSEETQRSEPANNNRIDEIFKSAKKNKFKFTRGPELWGPKQITAGPRRVNDDLVGIVVDDNIYIEVSPWAVKDGVYHQGLDSNYIVHYLQYSGPILSYEEILKQRQAEKENKKKRRSKS